MRRLPFFAAILFSFSAVFAQADSGADAVIAEAVSKRDTDAALEYLADAVKNTENSQDKKRILAFYANLQEQLGLYDDAASSYYEAAFCGRAAGDDMLLLDAARCALSVGDAVRAEAYLNPVMLTSSDEAVLARARLYAVWIQLSRADSAAPSGGTAAQTAVLRTYLKMPSMASVLPSVLLTLWWIDGDEEAAAVLKKDFPRSPEASVVSGDASLLPGPFWYFVPRSAAAGMPVPPIRQETVQQTERPPAPETGTSVPPDIAADIDGTKAVWQQLGFFREKENADRLADELRARGFPPQIIEQPRPSGTVYFAVMVRENAAGTIGAQLKNAGFECFPVFE